MRVLVDMDGVLADFEGGFLNCWRKEHPDKEYIPLEQRNTFFIEDQYPAEYKELIQQVMYSPGFISSLPPIPGGLDALTEMISGNIEVFICTSPFVLYQNCVLEKYEWIEKYFGIKWIKQMILAFDKTLIKADYLIDDMPVINGLEQPTWTHIIYDHPKNAHERSKKRLTWDNWKEIMMEQENFRQAYRR